MAAIHSDSHASGHGLPGTTKLSPPEKNHHPSEAGSILDLLGPDDPLHKEMKKLLSENQNLKNAASNHARSLAAPGQNLTSAEDHLLSESEELRILRTENVQLRSRLNEMEQLLDLAANESKEVWSEQQKEFETLLEEKSEVIRTLHQQLKELKEQYVAPQKPSSEDQDSLKESEQDYQTLRRELMALKAEMEQQRQQLGEDERALMDQMREMEMALSKERVEMARQRSELQRLHQDLQHEIEQAQRDSGLRERLIALQRRTQAETGSPPPAAPAPGKTAPRRAVPTQTALPRVGADNDNHRNGNGLLRRLFG